MKMKKLLAVVFCMILCVGCLAGCGGGGSDSGDTYVLKIASDEPNDSASSQAVEKFGEAIAEATDGQVTVEYMPDGAMGGDREILESVTMGNLEMGLFNVSMYATYDEDWNILSLPYVFEDQESKYAMLDGEFGAFLSDKAKESTGTEVLAYAEGTPMALSNNSHPIKTVDEVKGVKMRVVEADINLDLYDAWGGTAVPMAFTEVYTALQQGTIDGVDTSPYWVSVAKFSEVAKYMTDTQHQECTMAIAINSEFLASMPEDLQQTVRDLAYEYCAVEQRQLMADSVATEMENIKADGVEIYELSDAEKQTFIDASRPVIEKYRDTISAELFEMLGL